MKKYIRVSIFVLLIGLLSSCATSKEVYGDYKRDEPSEVIVKKEKDIYIFWDLIQTRKADISIGTKDYEKVVKRNFFDAVVYYGSFGIFSFYTVNIRVNKKINDR